MDRAEVLKLLEAVQSGSCQPGDALETLRAIPMQDIGHTRLDTHRELRTGFAEVVYASGKSEEHLADIISHAQEAGQRLLCTRVTDSQFAHLKKTHTGLEMFERAGVIRLGFESGETFGRVVVLSAGTSDAAISEEAVRCAEFFGLEVTELNDVGVAGIHRLFSVHEIIESHDVAIVVAGMEGALPSVVAGITALPVIAVPTSVGYGANFGGLTALCSMLVACSPGITVVNINNGFGAAIAAAKTIRHIRK